MWKSQPPRAAALFLHAFARSSHVQLRVAAVRGGDSGGGGGEELVVVVASVLRSLHVPFVVARALAHI